MLEAPGQQISLTDPDARSMATSGRGSGVVGYNVQTARCKASPDRGYYHGDEIRACEQNGIDAYLPKPRTSPNRAKRQFDRAAFISVEQDDEYACPAGERLIYRFTRTEAAKEIWRYWTSACTHGAIKAQ